MPDEPLLSTLPAPLIALCHCLCVQRYLSQRLAIAAFRQAADVCRPERWVLRGTGAQALTNHQWGAWGVRGMSMGGLSVARPTFLPPGACVTFEKTSRRSAVSSLRLCTLRNPALAAR